MADMDNDGDLDLHVTNMSSVAASRILGRLAGKDLRHRRLLERQWSGNALLRNDGAGRFRDVSATAGPFDAEWAWGGGFVDINNDGLEDLHVPNGFLSGDKPHDARSVVFSHVIIAMQQHDPGAWVEEGMRRMGDLLDNEGYSFGGWSRDRLYLNRGDGRFLDISGLSGADSYPSDGRSAVWADFDNDGDYDIFVRATHGRAHYLFRNDLGQDTAALRITLEGTGSGTDAFGATVRVKTRDRLLTKVKHGSNGYLGQCDPRLLFGLGTAATAPATGVEWVEVVWPSGLVQRFTELPPGRSWCAVEGEEKLRRVDERPAR